MIFSYFKVANIECCRAMNCHRKTFLFLVLLHQSNGLKKDFQAPKYGSGLTYAVIDIIENFYINRTSTINIYHSSITEAMLKTNYDIINEILYQVRSKVVVQLEGYLDFRITNRKRAFNIVFIDSYESFWNIFRLMSPLYFDYQGFYLIVLTSYNDYQYQIMVEIFEYLWAEYIINVNIIWMVSGSDSEAIVYTYYPYTAFFCGRALPVQLNQFRFNKWTQHGAMFPDKMSNLYGCPLKVCIVVTPPFMMLKEDETRTLKPDGIDGVLLNVLSQRMNFSIILIQEPDQGKILINKSSTGR